MQNGSGTVTTAARVLQVLAAVTEAPVVLHSRDLRLYDMQLLDSLRTVELIVAFEEEFGLAISPAELEREQWATPQRIIEDIDRRLAA